MATYTGIKGQDIQVVSSDPSPLIPGQVWYNSTSNTFKGAVQVAGPACLDSWRCYGYGQA
jgi:hypothetical protein